MESEGRLESGSSSFGPCNCDIEIELEDREMPLIRIGGQRALEHRVEGVTVYAQRHALEAPTGRRFGVSDGPERWILRRLHAGSG